MSESNQPAQDQQTILKLTTDIVTAYASKSKMSADELVQLIGSVSRSLSSVGGALNSQARETPVPAVPINKSVTADFLVCLEDGKKLKMLKRHLRTVYDMTFAEYRAKWRLPHDYPAVAPNYAARRSTLAKSIGLGRRKPAGRPRKAQTAEQT